MKDKMVLFSIIFAGVIFMTVGIIATRSLKDTSLSGASEAASQGSQLGFFTIQNISASCHNSLPEVTLHWSASNRATNYDIQRRYPWGGAWESTGETDTLLFTDATYEPGYDLGSFSYRIVASNRFRTRTSNTKKVSITSCNTNPSPSPTPVPDPTPIPNPTPAPTPIPTTISWGAYIGYNNSDLATFETLIGTPLSIRAVFIGWGHNDDFPTYLTGSLQNSGKTLLLFWEPSNGDPGIINQSAYNYDSIINGNWDNYIVSFATAIKNYGAPVILVPFEEMNGDWYPWSGTNNNNSPEKHIAAWRHVHDLFAQVGVSNVKFGWAPNNTSWPNTIANDLTAYYPGNAYVDYVGLDGFNFNTPWLSFNDIFNDALIKISQYNKPIYIFSFASAEANDGGVAKASWITDALTVQIPAHNIAGWIWFNENKEQNWLVDSSTTALAAFKQAVQ
jgi:hypothetical protein